MFAHRTGAIYISSEEAPDYSRHPLYRIAWLSYQAAKALQGTIDGVHDQGAGNVPRRFVVCELGEGECPCPRCIGDPATSLSKTFRRWQAVNRKLLDFLDDDSPSARVFSGADCEPPDGESLSGTIERVLTHLGATP